MHARMHVIRQYFFAQSSEVLEKLHSIFKLMLVVWAHVVYSNSLWQVLLTIIMACGWPGWFWNDRYYYGALLQPSMDHNTRPYFTQLAIDYLLQQRKAWLKYVFIAYVYTSYVALQRIWYHFSKMIHRDKSRKKSAKVVTLAFPEKQANSPFLFCKRMHT